MALAYSFIHVFHFFCFRCVFLYPLPFAVVVVVQIVYVGQHSDPRCIYVPPSSGKTFYAFRIAYARCGTKPDLNGQFYENTVCIGYILINLNATCVCVFECLCLVYDADRFIAAQCNYEDRASTVALFT